MLEIELKAHVYNRRAVLESLASFAEYAGSVEKSDVYYSAPQDCPFGKGTPCPSARLRHEAERHGGSCTDTFFFTYKKKERREGGGAATEVNDEKECTLSNPEPIAMFLEASGFSPYLRKSKSVERYRLATAHGVAVLELCTVPPLGDFLEIEIMGGEDAGGADIAAVQAEIRALFVRCGIPPEAVELRYYSELLAEARSKISSQ